MGIPSVKLPEIQYYQKFFLINILSEKLYCCFHIHHQLMFGYIKFSLHSATLVPNNSFIMLVNILLFQNYSCQICNLLFSKLCQHNTLRPTRPCALYTSINTLIEQSSIVLLKQLATPVNL